MPRDPFALMDEILSKLRNRSKKEKKVQRAAEKILDESDKKNKPRDNSTLETENFSDDLFNTDNFDLSEGEFREPTSSQCLSPFQIMKLDFDRLRSMKRRSTYINVLSVIENKEYKIHSKLISLVKKIHRFNNDVVSMELVDESGSIFGSCLSTLVKEKNIIIGSVLVLSDFSLWRLDNNHINIVSSNVLEVL